MSVHPEHSSSCASMRPLHTVRPEHKKTTASVEADAVVKMGSTLVDMAINAVDESGLGVWSTQESIRRVVFGY